MESETASIDPALHRPNRRRLVMTGAVAAIAVSTLVIAGVVPRIRRATEGEHDRERAASEPAHVEVALPHHQAEGGKVVLPGTVQAVQEAVVNARSTGYIHNYT